MAQQKTQTLHVWPWMPAKYQFKQRDIFTQWISASHMLVHFWIVGSMAVDVGIPACKLAPLVGSPPLFPRISLCLFWLWPLLTFVLLLIWFLFFWCFSLLQALGTCIGTRRLTVAKENKETQMCYQGNCSQLLYLVAELWVESLAFTDTQGSIWKSSQTWQTQ